MDQKARRKKTVKLRKSLSDKLKQNCPRCEVPGCEEEATDAHHLQNPGMGIKDDRYRNLMALCRFHHQELENQGKVRWAAKNFFGGSYKAVCDYIAIRRKAEQVGKPVPGLGQIPMSKMSSSLRGLVQEMAIRLAIQEDAVFRQLVDD